MNTTSASLLERLKQPDAREAWDRFVDLYTPLLLQWAFRLGLASEDAADLVQDVLTHLLQQLPRFAYDRRKRFRGWLWTVTINQWRQRRRQPVLNTVGDNDLAEVIVPDGVAEWAEDEYRHYLVDRALRLMQTEFQPTTWKAFWECTAAGRPVAEVGAELGMSAAAVYAAKSRVLRRLREEQDGLLD